MFTIFIERNPHIGGPMQFKPVLFKGQLSANPYNFILQTSLIFQSLVEPLIQLITPTNTEG